MVITWSLWHAIVPQITLILTYIFYMMAMCEKYEVSFGHQRCDLHVLLLSWIQCHIMLNNVITILRRISIYEDLDKMLLSWLWLTHPLVRFLFPRECTRKMITSTLSSAGVIQNRAYVICYVKRPLPSLWYDTTRPIKLALLSCVVFSFVVAILTWTMPVTNLS